ncbi:universal stress protein [uncultured Roseivirga sp.]|uniref:universal stress protein n=1 Tax=uncultured Roseivirga sp. TaxID=543088 RepID=UPI0030D9BF35|tara:strand:- start:320302 stop:321228 length:927 start_codon:yes stop_codon:yes gene_type:complete
MYDLSKFQRVMVCLDLTEMDKGLIQYASMIAQILEVDSVYFLHVAESLELPAEVQEKYPDLVAPLDETLEHEIRGNVEKHFKTPAGCDVQIKVATGQVTEEVLKMAKVKVIDLMILGRRHHRSNAGLNSSKIAKSSPSSVMYVPENPKMELNKILIPIDYSEHSQMAFEIGMALQKQTGAKLMSNHIYRVPKGYYKSGKTFDEFADIMLENTKKDSEKFFKKMELGDTKFEHTFALDDDPHPADKIYKTASEKGADLIILGSKGRTSAAAFLIGSVAEKLVYESGDIPLFLVKKGKENLSLLEALFRL